MGTMRRTGAGRHAGVNGKYDDEFQGRLLEPSGEARDGPPLLADVVAAGVGV
jgi:hypothetical protein